MSGNIITITNKLDEDIRIVKISASCPFATNFSLNRDGRVESVEHWYKKSRIYDSRIAPKADAWLRLTFKERKSPPVVTLTFNSEKRKLRKERVRVPVKTKIS